MVGGAYLHAIWSIEGRLAIIATQGGHTAELDIALLMKKRARIVASTMRTRTPVEKGKIAQALEQHIWPKLPSKTTIRPIIDACFPLAEASRAHAHLENAHRIGKVLLTVP